MFGFILLFFVSIILLVSVLYSSHSLSICGVLQSLMIQILQQMEMLQSLQVMNYNHGCVIIPQHFFMTI